MAQSGGPGAPRRGMHPVLVVLLVLASVVVLGIAALVGTGLWVARHGGGYALARMIARSNPNMEIVGADDAGHTITLRNRRTGKEVTLSFEDARRGGVRLLAQDDGKSAQVEIGGDAAPPAWVPVYPGAETAPGVAASGESERGRAEGGNFTLTTPDDPARVAAFYQDRAGRMGMQVDVTSHGRQATIVAKGGDGLQGFTAVVIPHAGGTTVNLSYGRER